MGKRKVLFACGNAAVCPKCPGGHVALYPYLADCERTA